MHPLAPDLTKITDDELQKKRSDLHNKLHFAYRTGNGDLVAQLSMLIQDYDMEIQTRNQRLMDQMSKSSKNFGNIINISK